MDEECGKMFEEATRANETLIDFDFGFNNFHLEHVMITFRLTPSIDKENPR